MRSGPLTPFAEQPFDAWDPRELWHAQHQWVDVSEIELRERCRALAVAEELVRLVVLATPYGILVHTEREVSRDHRPAEAVCSEPALVRADAVEVRARELSSVHPPAELLRKVVDVERPSRRVIGIEIKRGPCDVYLQTPGV